MRTARLIAAQPWFFCTARVYRLSEPVAWEDEGETGETSYVVVSVTLCAYIDHGGPEAMAFACDEHGELLPHEDSRVSLGVAYSMRHEDALEAIGFAVEHGPEEDAILRASGR